MANIVTKSGTNSVHGDVFEFGRNAVFNARNFFDAKRDQLKRNQFVGVNIPFQPGRNAIQSSNVSGVFSFGDNPDRRDFSCRRDAGNAET